MQATADAADKVCTKLVGVLHAEPGDGVLPASTDYQLIGLMTDAVRALAELSPSQVWVGGTTPGGAG
jgi:hypothetical protein